MNRSRREAGVTLVEVVIVGGVLAVVVAAIYGLLGTGTQTYAVGMTKSDLESRASSVLEKVLETLMFSGSSVIEPSPTPPLSTSILTFQESAGFLEGKQLWGEPISIGFDLVPDEQDDGKDNNGNGLVDEGMVVQRLFPASGPARPVILTRWVREYLEGEVPNGRDDNGNGLIDEKGFSFDRTDTIWTVRLTLERRDSSGHLLTATAETSVRPRN